MKTKKDLRKATVASRSEEGKTKKLTPEKKPKNEKRALIEEIEEDEELDDYLNIRERESIEDYYEEDDDDFEEDDDEE